MSVAFMLILPVWGAAQKEAFPLTAKVISSTEETVPGTGGVVEEKTSPAVRNQFPNAPLSTTRRVPPESYIITRAEIGGRIYSLRGGMLIDPATYPATIEKRTVRLVVTDATGKMKTIKLYVLSVGAKQ